MPRLGSAVRSRNQPAALETSRPRPQSRPVGRGGDEADTVKFT